MCGFSLAGQWAKGELVPPWRPVLDRITDLSGKIHDAGEWTLLVDGF